MFLLMTMLTVSCSVGNDLFCPKFISKMLTFNLLSLLDLSRSFTFPTAAPLVKDGTKPTEVYLPLDRSQDNNVTTQKPDLRASPIPRIKIDTTGSTGSIVGNRMTFLLNYFKIFVQSCVKILILSCRFHPPCPDCS